MTQPERAGSDRSPARRLIADPVHGPLPALMLVLTVLTGVVDAVSILSLGRVFVANMTGNVVFIGLRSPGPPASRWRRRSRPSSGFSSARRWAARRRSAWAPIAGGC